MTGRRRLSFPQSQALALLGRQRAKIAGFKAEFEARKAAEYAEAVSDMVEEQAQIVATLLDLGTPKIRIAEAMGTKNYGNLTALDALAQQYRQAPDAPAQEADVLRDQIDEALGLEQEFLASVRSGSFQHVGQTQPNKHNEWEEIWKSDDNTITVLAWPEGRSVLDIQGEAEGLRLEENYNDEILEALYGEQP